MMGACRQLFDFDSIRGAIHCSCSMQLGKRVLDATVAPSTGGELAFRFEAGAATRRAGPPIC